MDCNRGVRTTHGGGDVDSSATAGIEMIGIAGSTDGDAGSVGEDC